MSGETDITRLVATLDAQARPGEFVMVTLAEVPPIPVEAMVREAEGVTIVVRREIADEQAWPYGFVASWITLAVHSSLHAVGLTAEVSRALAAERIPANMLAGFFHDHVLVPADRCADALRTLAELSTRGASDPRA